LSRKEAHKERLAKLQNNRIREVAHIAPVTPPALSQRDTRLTLKNEK
jgi:hypothetical protein